MGASESPESNPLSWARYLRPRRGSAILRGCVASDRCRSIAAQRLPGRARQSKTEKEPWRPVRLVPREPHQDGVALIGVKRIGFGAQRTRPIEARERARIPLLSASRHKDRRCQSIVLRTALIVRVVPRCVFPRSSLARNASSRLFVIS
jgi:hypothetical protein